STWLNKIYRDILGHDRDAGSQQQLNRLNSAPAGQALAVRTQVAIEVLTTTEYRNRQITKDYITFLGRTPGSAEVDFWRGLIEQNGFTQEQVIASIMSSPEYFLRPPLFP